MAAVYGQNLNHPWEAPPIAVEKQLYSAKVARANVVYRFKRDFLLTIASRDGASVNISSANAAADEAINILFPPVTEGNMGEYLTRAW